MFIAEKSQLKMGNKKNHFFSFSSIFGKISQFSQNFTISTSNTLYVKPKNDTKLKIQRFLALSECFLAKIHQNQQEMSHSQSCAAYELLQNMWLVAEGKMSLTHQQNRFLLVDCCRSCDDAEEHEEAYAEAHYILLHSKESVIESPFSA